MVPVKGIQKIFPFPVPFSPDCCPCLSCSRSPETHPCLLTAQSIVVSFSLFFAFLPSSLAPIFWQLEQYFMAYDLTTTKGFPLLPEVSLSVLAQGQIIICSLASKSQKTPNASQIIFGGSLAERSACQTCNPALPGLSHALITTWICFLVAPSSNPWPSL